jgi:hypothetical protein
VGGQGVSAAPGNSDVAIFDGYSTDCAIDATVNVQGIAVSNSYSAAISQGINSMTIGASGWTQAGGTFTGGGWITMNGNWTHTGGGTFNHNNGTVYCLNATFTVSPAETFYNLYFAAWDLKTFTVASQPLVVLNVLTLENTNPDPTSGVVINGGTIECRGGLAVKNNGCLYGQIWGSGTIAFLVAGDQTITSTSSGYNSFINAHLLINKPSGTVSVTNGSLTVNSNMLYSGTFSAPAASFSVQNDWIQTGGVFVHNNGTVVFGSNRSGTIDVPGSVTFCNFSYGSWDSTTLTIASGDRLIVEGTFRSYYAANPGNGRSLNGGTVEARGNVSVDANAFGGTEALTFAGGNSQSYNNAGGANLTGTFTVNKTGGVVTLASRMNVTGGGQDLIVTNGALNLDTNLLTVADKLVFARGAASNTVFRLRIAETNSFGRATVSGVVADLNEAALYVNVSNVLKQTLSPQQTFVILTGSSVSGTFPPVTFNDLWRGEVLYSPTTVTLTNLRWVAGGTLLVIR